MMRIRLNPSFFLGEMLCDCEKRKPRVVLRVLLKKIDPFLFFLDRGWRSDCDPLWLDISSVNDTSHLDSATYIYFGALCFSSCLISIHLIYLYYLSRFYGTLCLSIHMALVDELSKWTYVYFLFIKTDPPVERDKN